MVASYPPTSLTNLTSFKVHIGLPLNISLFDTQFSQWILQADSLIETWIDRTIGSKTYSNQYFRGNGTDQLILDQWPISSLGPVFLDDSGNYGTTTGSFAVTSTTTAALGTALPASSITANTVAGFDASGTLAVQNSLGQFVQVTYTGISGTTFTGCSGGVGTLNSGGIIVQSPSLLYEGVDYALRPLREGAGVVERLNGVWPDTILRRQGNLAAIEQNAPGNILLSYTAGFATVPPELTLAANLVVNQIRWMSPFNRFIQSETYEERSVSYFIPWKGDPLLGPVEMILAKFKRVSWG